MGGGVVDRLRQISIHALLAESDLGWNMTSSMVSGFLSTLSLRRATRVRAGVVRAARISIHALLAESDGISAPKKGRKERFLSTLSLRRATLLAESRWLDKEFLSTLSLRRATIRRNHFAPP